MQYEIVTLQEKTMIGFTARTAGDDPKMNDKISGLWKRLFQGGTFFTMKNKVNQYSIGLYSGYSSDAAGQYDITVGCEVSSTKSVPDDMVVRTIPSGRYAKFVIFGDMVQAVSKTWQEIWKLSLDRAYTGDFEEYVSTEENGDAEIHIYIAVK